MSTPYEFSIGKRRMIGLVVCACIIQILLFVAGIATGLIISPRRSQPPEQFRPVTQSTPRQSGADLVPASPPKQTVAKAPSGTAETRPPGAEQKPAELQTEIKTPAPSAPAGVAFPALAPRPVLAVMVSSFHDRDNALKLAALLKRQGFGTVTVGSPQSVDSTSYMVRLGPFHDWEGASRAADELNRSYDLHAYVKLVNAAGD